jgi:hypothetical protein
LPAIEVMQLSALPQENSQDCENVVPSDEWRPALLRAGLLAFTAFA